MKRTFSTLMLSLAVVANLHAAGGPDDQYLEIYSLIQQADGLTHDPKIAATRYLQAQAGLKKLQSVYPTWQPDVIKFRIDYVNEKLAVVQQNLAQIAATTPTPAPVRAVAPATPRTPAGDQEIAGLNEQIKNLTFEKSSLERKLKEALSVQPAPADTNDMAKAEQTINALKKERDLLTVTLEQEKASHSGVAPVVVPEPKPIQDFSTDEAKKVTLLTKERDALQAQVASLGKTIHQLQTQAVEDHAAMEKKLAEATKPVSAPVVAPVVVPAPKVEVAKAPATHHWYKFWASDKTVVVEKPQAPISNKADLAQIEKLRARVAVLEAKPLPHTSEELAIIKTANTKPVPEAALPAAATPAAAPAVAVVPAVANSGTTNAVVSTAVHTFKDLPTGAGALMSEGQRAFATGDFATAEQKFSEVLRQDERNVFVLSRLATAQLSANHTEGCEKSLKQALALEPNDAASLFLLGNLRVRQDKLDEALDALSRSASINPTNAATQNCLGGVLNQKGLRVPAEAALRKALQLDPSYPEAHHNLAIVYATQKPPFMELARWHYKKALDLGYAKNPELEKILDAK